MVDGSGPGRVRARARMLNRTPLTELPVVFSNWVELNDAAYAAFRERIFTLSRTFWLFLHQVLSDNASCSETVSKALVHLALSDGLVASANTSAYCQARKRLPQEVVDQVAASVAQRVEEEAARELWLGRQVKVVDGSSVSMPDTPDNQAAFAQPSSQKAGCGFPVMRLVCQFSLSTGVLERCEHGPLSDHERTLWRRLWPGFEAGDVILADRGFCGFADFALLSQRGVDTVMRLHARRSTGVHEVERLGRGDWLVEWDKPPDNVRPEWLSDEQWAQLPDRLRVRQVSVSVSAAGFRSQAITIATTLLDAKRYPARDLAELYRRRWQAELFLRDLKVTLGMDPLRCKSADMVVKELGMYLVAYNLIRALMWRSAAKHDLGPTALSFKTSLGIVRQWAPAMVEAEARARHLALLDLLLHYLACTTVPLRPGRSEPRARKRRPKNYQLLNQPRRLMKPVKHRNRYEKPLS